MVATAALDILTDELLLAIAEHTTAQQLGRLTLVSRRFRDLPLEDLAERALLSAEDGWRVKKRVYPRGESFRFLLDVIQRRLAPLPSLGAGGRHTVVLQRSAVFTFGSDDSSQLGLGESNVPRQQPVDESAHRTVPERVAQLPDKAVSVTAGSEFCMAIAKPTLETQNEVGLWAWGWLGSAAAAVSELVHLDDWVVSAPLRVPISSFVTGDPPTLIALGCNHQAAISAKGRLIAWGACSEGQIGECVPGQLYFIMPQVVSGLERQRFVSVACGDEHTAAVTSSGKLFVLGNSFVSSDDPPWDRLPVPTPMPAGAHVRGVSCGENHVATWTTTGQLYTFGLATSGQLGLGSWESLLETFTIRSFIQRPQLVTGFDSRSIVSASCGDLFTAALTNDGQLYTWGHGGHGRLGHGAEYSATSHCWEPQRVRTMSLSSSVSELSGGDCSLPCVVEVSCGWSHSVLKLADGRIFAWGQGDCGQLGQGTKVDRLVPTLVRLCGQ